VTQLSLPTPEIYFDLETLRLSHELPGGWSSIEKFGLAVGVTWDATHAFRRWFESDAAALIRELATFPRIITFNGERFDFTVLGAYGSISALRKPSFDLLVDLQALLGHRVKLDDLARDTLGTAKTGSGTDVIRWWRAGDRERVCRYCENDVKLLVDLVAFARRHGHVRVGQQKVRVNW